MRARCYSAHSPFLFFSLPAVMLALLAATAATAVAQQAKAPTAEQALTLAPIQPGIEYTKPSRDEAKQCKIQPERAGKSTSWAVRDGSGQLLRRFADTNADNVVDTWSYYHNGLEVYRDIDSDFDSKADQYRWFHTGGSRWGIDKNQDGKIDQWKQISPQEVAEEVVTALQHKDTARFARLLLSDDEARHIGLGKGLAKKVSEQRKGAADEFRKLAASQKKLSPKGRFVDFGASKPGVVPAGVDGSTKDIVIYENASALVDNEGAPEQVLLGSLFRVGAAWRLVESPKLGDSGPELANVFSVPGFSAAPITGQPSDAMQAWMAELEKLDQQATSAPERDLERSTARRSTLLKKLAEASKGEESAQWYTQLADLLSAAAQSSGYEAAIKQLADLEQSPGVKRLGKGLTAHVRYRRIAGEYGLALREPKADYAKVQEKWLADLEKFVKAFPGSDDAAEAMLQLGMGEEFAGEIKKAEAWYNQLRQEYPRAQPGQKAAGALRRLGSIGKTISLKGEVIGGGKIDLAKAPYRGKHVIIHYWATWCEPCKEDMKRIAEFQRRYGKKLAVIGVNLDTSPADAKAYLASTRNGWKHLYDKGGLDGKYANEMGVMTLPLMLLVDNRGQVANRNLHSGELDEELRRVIR